jgi:hypothetical protein
MNSKKKPPRFRSWSIELRMWGLLAPSDLHRRCILLGAIEFKTIAGPRTSARLTAIIPTARVVQPRRDANPNTPLFGVGCLGLLRC